MPNTLESFDRLQQNKQRLNFKLPKICLDFTCNTFYNYFILISKFIRLIICQKHPENLIVIKQVSYYNKFIIILDYYMPRRGGSSGSRSRSRSSSPGGFSRGSFASSKPMQQNPTSQTTNASYKSPGMMGGLGSTLMTGMAFGAGSEVAHNIVRGMTGSGGQSYVQNQQSLSNQPPGQTQPYQTQTNPCMTPLNQLSFCLQNNKENISACQSLFDSLSECRKKNNI